MKLYRIVRFVRRLIFCLFVVLTIGVIVVIILDTLHLLK